MLTHTLAADKLAQSAEALEQLSHCTMTMEYTNWEGTRDIYVIKPLHFWFGSTQWHPERQLMLHAFMPAKNAIRDFAVKDIHWSRMKWD